jgi:hypothetical protein
MFWKTAALFFREKPENSGTILESRKRIWEDEEKDEGGRMKDEN